MARKYLSPTGQAIAETGAKKYLGPGGAVVAESQSSGTSGAAAFTESTDSVAAAGGIIVTGSAAITGANDSVSASGGIVVQGSAAITGASDSVSASGSVSSSAIGSAAITEHGDIVVAVSAHRAAGRIKPKPAKRRVLVDGKLMELTPAELGAVVKKRITRAKDKAKPDETPAPVEIEVLPVEAKKGADVVDEPREVYRAPSVAISMPAEFVPDFQAAAPDVMARIIEQHRARIEFEAAQEAEKARRRRNEQALAILMLTL